MNVAIRNKFLGLSAILGVIGIGAGIGIAGLAIGAIIIFGQFAAITALQALIVWFVWNLAAPAFSFMPAEYIALGFMQVWGAVAILRIIGRILFGTVNKGRK